MPSELFWNSVLITGSGLLLAILAICYKSKCSNIKCCGCIEIQRNVDLEEKYDEIELESKNNNDSKQDEKV